MGTTGVIFGAIAIAWLAYLVPHFVRKRDDEAVIDADDPAERFSRSMRVVQHGTAPLLDQDLSEIGTYEVSTPLTRRAAIADLRRLENVAALRRRRVLLILMAVLSLVVGLAGAELIPWWSTAIPGGLLVLFFAVSRFSVVAMRRSLDARYRDIQRGGDEVTVFINRAKIMSESSAGSPDAETAAAREDAPAEPEKKPVAGALWDPVPITMPTYVSKPLAPRTVRTIDLSGPAVSSDAAVQHPVTADPQPASARTAGVHTAASAQTAGEVAAEESEPREPRAASA